MGGAPQQPHKMGRETAVRSYVHLLRRYERLIDISLTLNTTLEINSLLEHIVRAATELTETEAASILLMEPNSGTLRFEATVDPVGLSLESIAVPLEGSIAGRIFQEGEPVVIADVANDPVHFRAIDEQSGFTTRNLLGVPMMVHERTIGVLEAVNKHDGMPFTDDDVTALRTLAGQAAVAIENARLFEQSDLISEMVHELRTPLAAIQAITHLLQKSELEEERRDRLVKTIRSEIERLTRMTSEFLNLTRLESGRTRLVKEPFDLGEVVQWSVQTIAPQAGDRNVEIINEVAEDALPALVGDRPKMQQVMLNLLTNAIKYNREDGTVTVRGEVSDGSVHVSISDTGVGISPDHLPHVFDKFYRVSDMEGYTHGTGLGLAIAKSIVEGHDGQLVVTSEEGTGTTFTMTLPLPEPDV